MSKVELNYGVEMNTLITESKYKQYVKLHGDVPCLKCLVRPTCYNEFNFGLDDVNLEITVPINGDETTVIIPYNELTLQYPIDLCKKYADWLCELQKFGQERYRCFVTG
jgi:hypothetical protein